MTTETTRRCRAWLDCGNVSVALEALSFRGFCPRCEAVANGGPLCDCPSLAGSHSADCQLALGRNSWTFRPGDLGLKRDL